LIFSRRTQPPSGSTLFPYTTLFRSYSDWNAWQRAYDELDRKIGECAAFQGTLAHGAERLLAAYKLRDEIERRRTRRTCGRVRRTDRKSTRLNSSHVEISYAVFCLKK